MLLIWIELIILCGLFWGICYLGTGTDEKNIKSYYSYPDDAQNIVKANPKLNSKIKPYKPLVSFISNLIMFLVILFVFGFFIKSNTYLNNLINILLLGQILNLFDFLVIDTLWWRNSSTVRFTGTENKPELYSNPKKHFLSFLKGCVMFLIVAIIDGLLLTVI